MLSLERLLDGLEVTVDPFLVRDARQPRAQGGPTMSRPTVPGTLSDAGVLELAGGASVRFSADSVSVLPPGRPRSAQEGAERRAGPAPRPVSPAFWRAAGDGGDHEVVASGQIRATYQGAIGLFDDLQEPLVEKLDAEDPLRRAFEELRDEIASERPGSRAMAEALLRRCLILLLRRYGEHGGGGGTWLAALEDGRLGRAVTAMQDKPERPFTLSALAELARMSRSVFAARFADALGQSPMEFLKTLRLRRAAQLLTRSDLPVKSIASRVGYSSRSSFTRAFVACYGVGPMGFRAAGGSPPPAVPALGHGPFGRAGVLARV